MVLSWTPGIFAPSVNGHKVYLSENFNDVSAGIGGVTLEPGKATLDGVKVDTQVNEGRENIGYWDNADDKVHWLA